MRGTERVVDQGGGISLIGQLVFQTRKIYQQAIKDAKEKSPRRIVLNLEGLPYLDSAGLG